MILLPPQEGTGAALYQWALLIIPVIGFTWMSVQKFIADTRKSEEAITLELAGRVRDRKIDAITQTVDTTHALVNGGKGLTLQLIANQAEELARLKSTPESSENARLARKAYNDHMGEIAATMSAQAGANAQAAYDRKDKA